MRLVSLINSEETLHYRRHRVVPLFNSISVVNKTFHRKIVFTNISFRWSSTGLDGNSINNTDHQNFILFLVFLTNFDFLITFRYLTTERGKIFTLSDLSFAYYHAKDTYYEGSLNKVKS